MSQTPQQKLVQQKMCKSPKNQQQIAPMVVNNCVVATATTTTTTAPQFHIQKHHQHHIQEQPPKIDYEHLSTNCTVVGSNNLNLVKKPATSMSPAYSNPSPGSGGGSYHPPSSPYSSPASLKSPSPQLKPPTPQPAFPVMQIIHNSHHSLLARPISQHHQPQNIIKLKPHLNILPKPSASPQPSPKPSVSPQIVIPTNHHHHHHHHHQQATATIMPTAQPVLLNQMPLLTTTPSVQFILRPQTAKPQGLILQPSGQQLLQIQPQTRTQPMVRVLTNGVQLAAAPTTTTAYVTSQQQINNNTTVAPPPPPQVPPQQQQQSPNSPQKIKKPKNKVKKKLDLANIMKLSGIGDEDDIQFESDASQSEPEPAVVEVKKIATPQPPAAAPPQPQNILSAQLHHHQPINSINTTPVVQVLNQNFINNNTQQGGQASVFSPFITPNFTINNGLMVQRSTGGFKLTLAEDGRLVLQHDPTLNQDLQSQLFLQSILGLNGGLVLQPSLDQQTTVQTIQQQSVQTIQQQTVQSQTIQTVQQQTVQPQHAGLQQQTVQQTIQHQTVQSQPIMQQPMQIVQPHLHTIQSQIQGQLQSLLQQQHNHHPQPTYHQQPVLKVQPFQKTQTQPPVQTVHPQPQQPQENHQQQQQQQQQQPTSQQPASYVVNLTPDQLEQLKRNGQLTVNGQTIFMQRPGGNKDDCKKLSPKIKPVTKKIHHHVAHKSQSGKVFSEDKDVKEIKSSLITALQSPPKHISQQKAIVQPSIKEKQQMKPQTAATSTTTSTTSTTTTTTATTTTTSSATTNTTDSNGATNQEVEKLLGQILEENGNINIITSATPTVTNKNQRIHTIQLTPQKQEHLKNIQVQIQTLSASLTPGNADIQAALKMLFAEQQKILATGKLLPPDKVYYHNNHLTIINPSSLTTGGGGVKSNSGGDNATTVAPSVTTPQDKPFQAAPSPVLRSPHIETSQVTQSQRISVSIPASVNQEPPQTVIPASSATLMPPAGARLTIAPIILNNAPSTQNLVVKQQQNTAAKKSQLIDTQLNLDQAGAVKPDIHSPFKDKKDACIRLIRYHCFDQPVLSQKDLQKADEIFELTAKHFIGKYGKMVDKYNFLLMKESMRQVQTSELMMLDRMYLAEERQSLLRLRQEADEAAQMAEMQPPTGAQAGPSRPPEHPEDYDEWACIQRELGCLPEDCAPGGAAPHPPPTQGRQQPPHTALVYTNPKRTASSDSRLETLKRFRVEKHNKKSSGSNNNNNSDVTMGHVAMATNHSAINNNNNNNNNHSGVQNVASSGILNNFNLSNNNSQQQQLLRHHQQQHQDDDDFHLNLRHASGDDTEVENNSIDEQVQSAIDSILNLQQNTALDLDSILS